MYSRGLKQVSARLSHSFVISRRGMRRPPDGSCLPLGGPAALPRAAQRIGTRQARGSWACLDSAPHSTSPGSLAADLEPFLSYRRAASWAPRVTSSPLGAPTPINPLHGPAADVPSPETFLELRRVLSPPDAQELSSSPPRSDPRPAMDRCKKCTKAQPLLQGGTRLQGHTHARAPVQNSLDIKSKNEP